MSETPREVAIDAASNRMGHVMGRDRDNGRVTKIWLRPVNGGLEWDAHPDDVLVVEYLAPGSAVPPLSRHRLKPDFTGTEDEIQAVIWGTSARLDLGRRTSPTAAGLITADEASALIEGGEPAVMVDGRLYQVAEPEWTVEQDVYGCEEGRSCPDVSEQDRKLFEALIAARLAAGPEAAG